LSYQRSAAIAATCGFVRIVALLTHFTPLYTNPRFELNMA